jgi:LysM repeat protein
VKNGIFGLNSVIFTPTAPEPSPTIVESTTAPTIIFTSTATLPVSAEASSEQPEICDSPAGWLPYTIKNADTLNKLAASSGISPQELADANCLKKSQLTVDTIIFLPPAPPPTSPAACGAPRNWVVYYVQQGDTLFDIAQRVNSTVSQLKNANCLISNTIRTGQKLFVPYLPAPKPGPTVILPTQTPPPPPSPTSTQVPLPTPTDGNISIIPPPYPYPSP